MEFYAKVPMKLTLSGKFHQVAKFFDGVGQAGAHHQRRGHQDRRRRGDGADVDVECLATAFRAIRPGEARGRKRGTGR